jgi:hypothetical protein
LGNDLEIKRDIPPPTPQLAKSLSPQDLHEHRAMIASEVRVVLSAYFQPTEAEDVKAAQLAWWCDELQDWTREQVVWGLRKWNRESPRARPTPGDIVGILKAQRGKAEAARMPKLQPLPQQSEITEEDRQRRAEFAERLLRGSGFKRMETEQ